MVFHFKRSNWKGNTHLFQCSLIRTPIPMLLFGGPDLIQDDDGSTLAVDSLVRVSSCFLKHFSSLHYFDLNFLRTKCPSLDILITNL
jgi:hypothetical protein